MTSSMPGAHSAGGSSRLTSLAQILGVRPADLRHAFRSGTDLPDLLRQNGIPPNALDRYTRRRLAIHNAA